MTPRVLGLDDYFMVENEKFIVDKDNGRKVKKRVIEFFFYYKDSIMIQVVNIQLEYCV